MVIPPQVAAALFVNKREKVEGMKKKVVTFSCFFLLNELGICDSEVTDEQVRSDLKNSFIFILILRVFILNFIKVQMCKCSVFLIAYVHYKHSRISLCSNE